MVRAYIPSEKDYINELKHTRQLLKKFNLGDLKDFREKYKNQPVE